MAVMHVLRICLCFYLTDDGPDKRPRQRWGHCELCDVSLYSEQEAHDHVSTFQHRSNEGFNDGSRNRGNTTRSSSDWPRDSRESPNKYDRPYGGASKFSDRPGYKRDKFRFDSWKTNPEEIPKRSDYYEHDNRSRDDMNFWERKQMYLQTGRYPRGGPRGGGLRGRGVRGGGDFGGGTRGFRGGFRGRGNSRGFSQNPPSNFLDKSRFGSSSSRFGSTSGQWKHDKFSELEVEDGEDKGDHKSSSRREKDDHKRDKAGHKDRRDDDKDRKEKSANGKGRQSAESKGSKGGNKKSGEKEADEIRKEEEDMKIDVAVELG